MTQMKQNNLDQQQLLTALRVHKNLPSYYTEQDLADAKIILKKKINLGEAFDVVDLLVYPYSKQLDKLNHDLSIANMVLDKLGATPEQWEEAQTEFEKADRENKEKAQAEFKELLEKEKAEMEAEGTKGDN